MKPSFAARLVGFCLAAPAAHAAIKEGLAKVYGLQRIVDELQEK